MTRVPLIALIVLLALGSTAWPDVCARRADCCAGGACHMRSRSCHHDEAPKSVIAHIDRMTMSAAPMMPAPRAKEIADVDPVNALIRSGVDRTPDRPPRLVSPLC